MHPSNIAFAIAIVASPLALMTPANSPARSPALTFVAEPAAKPTTVNGHPLVDAPLSKLEPDNLPVVDRAAQPGLHSDEAGPANGTPFSAAGSGTLSEGGTQPDQHDRSFAAADHSGVVPNLGR